MRSTFWPNCILASKFSKSWKWPQILAKTGKQWAFHENSTKRSFQVIRSTFCPNRIFERQSFQRRHSSLKVSLNRENGAFIMKIVQNALFRSCAARFGQIVFSSVKVHKIENWPEMLFKPEKQCAFQENCTKPAFQVMRGTFWPNRIFERQSFQIGHTSLKFSPKRENSGLSMKILHNALFRSCGARFGQIVFLSVKVLKIVTLVSNSFQNGKKVRSPWKLYKMLFSGHAEHVLAKSHFWASKFSKSWNWPQILLKTEKQCALHENSTKRSLQVMRSTFWPNRIFEHQSFQRRHTSLKVSSKRENGAFTKKNCTKRSFQVMRSTLWPNRILERQSSPNRHTGLILSSKRENSALSIKIVQDALCRSCAARFGQIAFLSVKVFKDVTLVSRSLQSGKMVRLPWKFYKTLFSGHAQHVLAKSYFWAWKCTK